jgi:PAS domain S-box-containing protein
MNNMNENDRIRNFEEQIDHLNREKRAMLDAIEMVANLSNFRVSLNKIDDPQLIISETADRIRRIIELKALSFYLVSEEDSDFYQALSDPIEYSERIENEVEALIEDKTFSWALDRNKPVIVSSLDRNSRVVLHSLSTSSRVRGVFVGILKGSRTEISDLSLFLFSITMVVCSNALESFELYRQIRARNKELKDNIQQIQESEQKYRALFEQAANAIILYDPETRKPVQFNDKAHNNLGFSREEFMKLSIDDLEIQDTEQDSRSHTQQLYKQGPFSYETQYLMKDGGSRDIIVNNRPITIKGKLYLISLLTDITFRKEHEVERMQLEKQLRQVQKMESIGTLAGGIAHDFNNILAIILGYAELSILDLPKGSNGALSNLEQLIQAVDRAKKLVMQILTFSRQGDETMEPIEINPVIQESLILLRASLPSTIEMNQQIDKEPLHVLGDATQIHQILMNLCTNAAHAMKNRNGQLNVELKRIYLQGHDESEPHSYGFKGFKPGPFAEITVRDNGDGMTQDVVERVFDPYFTTKKAGEGTGLGLSVVHGIVEKYKGHIIINSTPGIGTIVKVRIPKIGSTSTIKVL